MALKMICRIHFPRSQKNNRKLVLLLPDKKAWKNCDSRFLLESSGAKVLLRVLLRSMMQNTVASLSMTRSWLEPGAIMQNSPSLRVREPLQIERRTLPPPHS